MLCSRINKTNCRQKSCILWLKCLQKQVRGNKVDCLSDVLLCFSSSSQGDGIPTVFVAVAGRSNGLGPVMSGNTAYPVVNCPPLSADWGAQDVWSSLRLPSGKTIFNQCCCTDIALLVLACVCAHTLFGTVDQYWTKSLEISCTRSLFFSWAFCNQISRAKITYKYPLKDAILCLSLLNIWIWSWN